MNNQSNIDGLKLHRQFLTERREEVIKSHVKALGEKISMVEDQKTRLSDAWVEDAYMCTVEKINELGIYIHNTQARGHHFYSAELHLKMHIMSDEEGPRKQLEGSMQLTTRTGMTGPMLFGKEHLITHGYFMKDNRWTSGEAFKIIVGTDRKMRVWNNILPKLIGDE